MKNPFFDRFFFTALIVLLFTASCQEPAIVEKVEKQTGDIIMISDHEIKGAAHYVDGYPALLNDSIINVVIEIPAGATAKWEVDKTSGTLTWEKRGGDDYRHVKYLGYPANYGMIPQTYLPKNLGGDGDPLDVLVLGAPLEMGSVVPCKLIGVMRLLDHGEQDDKLLAVHQDSPFFALSETASLDNKYKGVTTILSTWFENYKGPGILEFLGYGDREEALMILEQSMNAYQSEKK